MEETKARELLKLAEKHDKQAAKLREQARELFRSARKKQSVTR